MTEKTCDNALGTGEGVRKGVRLSSPFSLRHVDPTDMEMQGKAKDLVFTVAVEEKGWPIGDYIDRFKERAQLFTVLVGDLVVGAVLIVEGDRGSFPIRSENGWPNLESPPGSSVEIPFVVVDKRYRSHSGVSYILCSACHWYLVNQRVDYIELTLDEQLAVFYSQHGMSMERIPLERGGGEKHHWGESGIFPARLFVGDPREPGSMGSNIKRDAPQMWELFLAFKS